MPLQQFVFSETPPSSAGTAASSNAVSGSLAANIPNGVAGLLDDYESVNFVAEITPNAGGTLDVYVQLSPNGGSKWFDVIHFTQVAGGGSTQRQSAPLSQATNTVNTTTIGVNLFPSLTAGTVVNGAFLDRCRLVMVSGAGTSAAGSVTVYVTAQRSRLREGGGS